MSARANDGVPGWPGATAMKGRGLRFISIHLALAAKTNAPLLALAVILAPARAQDQQRHFTQPLLVMETGGHHAPVRDLEFVDPAGRLLLSGGLDKVVREWNLAQPGRNSLRVLRPPIWRGYAGAVYAMALSPPRQGTERILAVAGYGVESSGGNITLFRYPGHGEPTGEILAHLIRGPRAVNPPAGHVNTVACLAFDPTGRYLASGSLDRTVRIWDIPARRTIAVLPDHGSDVSALAWASEGRRLITTTGGATGGVTRLWDTTNPQAPRLLAAANPARPGPQRRGDAILALAVSADATRIVIGRENGLLSRLDPALRLETFLNDPGREGRGAIEAIDLSPSGQTMAVSVVAHALRAENERPRTECLIHLRAYETGRILQDVATTDLLAYAVRFSPDGSKLAHSGGKDQAIIVHSVANDRALANSALAFGGQGQSVLDIGWNADSTAVAWSRTDRAAAQPDTFEAFHLRDRLLFELPRADLRRDLATYQGARVQYIDPRLVELISAQGAIQRIELTDRDRRWWCDSFIPPGPGHARPVLAIGCEGGVIIVDLASGRRVRYLAGHAAPVMALAPSPDGKWLATGSTDQTVRLWPLDAIDQPAPLGAEILPEPDNLTGLVRAVTPGSHAEAMGLLPGDRVLEAYLAAKKQNNIRTFLEQIDQTGPDTSIELVVRRPLVVLGWNLGPTTAIVATTRREHPALSLFVGRDRDWLAWMPRGYYDASIAGDARFAGWHLNRSRLERPRSTDFLALVRFENDLRQPRGRAGNLIDQLLASGRPAEVLAAAARAETRSPGQNVLAAQPSGIRVELAARPANAPAPAPDPVPAPALAPLDLLGSPVPVGSPLPPEFAFTGNSLPVRLLLDSEHRDHPRSLAVKLDGVLVREIPLPTHATRTELALDIPMPAGRHRLQLEARADSGIPRTLERDIDVALPLPAPAPAPDVDPAPSKAPRSGPRLLLVTIAPEFHDKRYAIPFAREDTRAVAPHLESHLVPATAAKRFQHVELVTLEGPDAQANAIESTLRELAARDFEPNDLVALWVETHVLDFGSNQGLVAADVQGIPPDRTANAQSMAEALATIAAKCRVVLFLDGVHQESTGQISMNIHEWVRALRNDSGVTTLVASTDGPGRVSLGERHRVFAQAVLGASRPTARSTPGEVLSLGQLRDVVTDSVQNLSRRLQFAACYLPDSIDDRVPIYNPQAQSPATPADADETHATPESPAPARTASP